MHFCFPIHVRTSMVVLDLLFKHVMSQINDDDSDDDDHRDVFVTV